MSLWHNGKVYFIRINIRKNPVVQNGENVEMLSYTVIAETGGKKKTILVMDGMSDWLRGAVSFFRYYVSPYEERALVVVMESSYTRIDYVYIGCHLLTGFR